jgi:hypothetical protein
MEVRLGDGRLKFAVKRIRHKWKSRSLFSRNAAEPSGAELNDRNCAPAGSIAAANHPAAKETVTAYSGR